MRLFSGPQKRALLEATLLNSNRKYSLCKLKSIMLCKYAEMNCTEVQNPMKSTKVQNPQRIPHIEPVIGHALWCSCTPRSVLTAMWATCISMLSLSCHPSRTILHDGLNGQTTSSNRLCFMPHLLECTRSSG